MRTRVAVAGLLALIVMAGCAPAPVPTFTTRPASGPPTPSAALSTQPPASAGSSAAPGASASSAAPSASSAPSATPAASPLAGGWSLVGTRRCRDQAGFECVTLAVPRDHFTPGGPTWDVTFAIRRATRERLGTFVVVTGGPGSSGISSAVDDTDGYPASIPEHFDIVFLDQRGIGESHPIACPVATATFYASDVRRQDPAEAAAAGEVAKTYVDACLAEARADPADLPYYATRQAAEDLEAIRAYLGVPKLELYGESYGTQFAQTYAAAHPDRIATLFLDGPVDLTLDAANYYAEATRSFDGVLTATLNACAADARCAADFGGRDPVAEYDRLAARLANGPIAFDFPLGDGTTQRRSLTSTDLENAAIGYLYATTDRMLLQRAIAAASDGDLVPLARLAYASIAVDPDTQQAVPDPSYSDALYYAVECQDYVYQGDKATDAERLAGFLDDARALGVASARLGGVYYEDIPCLYWPNRPAVDTRPAPIVAAPYPTIVMVASADPITPVANAIRIANRLTDVHTIIETGGPHVIFGWGLSCPDDLVADLLVEGRVPASPITVCEGSVVDDYVPLAKDTEAAYADAADLMGSLAAQVLNTDDYVYELDQDPIRMGCDFGGVLVYTPSDGGTRLRLDACELTDGLPVTGTGTIDDEGTVTLDVTLPDGSLHYRGDGASTGTVSGTFRGRPVKG